ncbi:hypothetical protein [Micromonospora sp. NPDC007230]|uniref:hypothetical protein n=1 Tax=Micromonospora sp. NPDC007230 TaxID=3364237 RepID=UPI0036973BA7
MAAVSELIHGNTSFLQQFAGRLDPTPVVAVRTAAAEVASSAQDCGDPLPGCQRYNAAVRDATNQIIAFCTEVEQGIAAYAAVARGSAADYVGGDEAGRNAIQGALAAQPAFPETPQPGQ